MKERMLETLEEIDQMLDKLDLLVNKLPIPRAVKQEICSDFYDVWVKIEDAVDCRAADFD